MSRCVRTERLRRGFTLVEALVTLVLAAIILPVAMRAITVATSAAGEARSRAEASALAEAYLADLVQTGAWQGSDLSGDCGPDWPGYRWRAEVADWQTAAVRELSVRVEWETPAGVRDVRLTTLVYAEGE